MNAKRTTSRWVWWALWALVPVGALLLWAAMRGQGGFVAAAAGNPVFIKFSLIAVGCLLALLFLGRILLRMGRTQPRKSNLLADNAGTATIEFCLVLPVAVGIVLIMIQAMMMMTATMMVSYSAYAAARTAVVWVPKDLSYNVPQGFASEPENVVVAPPDSFKMARVREAAALALLPVAGRMNGDAPNADQVIQGIHDYYSAYSEPSPNWVNQLGWQKFAYAWHRTDVQLGNWGNPNGKQYGPAEDVEVWVTHDYQLGVPFAQAILADDRTNYTSKLKAVCTLSNEGESDTILEDQFN